MTKTDFERIHRFNCLASDLDALYHQAAKKLGISDSALCVLYMIHENGTHCPLSDIYKKTGNSKQTIHSAVRKLEQEGILYLEQPHGRAKEVCLTEQGKRYVMQTAARLFEAECSAFHSWTEEEISTYLQLMKKYNLSLRSELEKLDLE